MIKVSIDRQVMQSAMNVAADQIKSKIDLNLNYVKKLCKKRYGIETIEGAENKNANIVIIDNKFACKLDFEVRFPMWILITTKEDSNITITEKSALQAEIDAMPEGLDDIAEYEVDDIAPELDDLAEDEVDEIAAELDDLMEDEVDEILLEDLKADNFDDEVSKDLG